jgi:hypothetical protein
MQSSFVAPAQEFVFVMAGLVPAIHVFLPGREGVDARHKAGHDDSLRWRSVH